jgi:hypothetical protein
MTYINPNEDELSAALIRGGISDVQEYLKFERLYGGILWFNGFEVGMFTLLNLKSPTVDVNIDITDTFDNDAECPLVQCLQVNWQDSLWMGENGYVYFASGGNCGPDWKKIVSDRGEFGNHLTGMQCDLNLTKKWKTLNPINMGLPRKDLGSGHELFLFDKMKIFTYKGSVRFVFTKW